uniref:Tyrosine-protein phosphatase domain-containing protein n=1 Tax=Heterorhabditis bacteriophora TaxID=37862 RepID=A0A1I7X3W0_HETBA
MDSNLGGKKSNWRQGSGGGGNTTPDAGPVKPNPWNKGTGSGRDNSDIRKSSMDEKQAALTAAKNIGSGQLSVQRSSSQTSIFSQESDTEDLREKCEANYSKIMNMVDSDLKEYEAGDLSIQDVSKFEIIFPSNYGFNFTLLFQFAADLFDVFRRIMQASVEKVKKPLLSKLGHVLCFALQKEESKAEALQGIAKYCQFAVDTETWIDFPEAWNNLSEVLINAIQCDLKLFEGKRPSINDFSEAFVEASKDDRENKPYQLLVTVLRRMCECCGSGLEDPQILHDAKDIEVTTPYGKPSDKLVEEKRELYIYRTNSRSNTYFDGTYEGAPGVCHIQMHPAYNEKLRQCVLAKELGIPYATTALVTDYDCWKEDEHVSMELVMMTFKENAEKAKRLFVGTVKKIAEVDWKEEIAHMKSAARNAVMVSPEVVIPHLL